MSQTSDHKYSLGSVHLFVAQVAFCICINAMLIKTRGFCRLIATLHRNWKFETENSISFHTSVLDRVSFREKLSLWFPSRQYSDWSSQLHVGRQIVDIESGVLMR